MNGKWLMGGLVGFALIFGAALWYFQEYAYYERIEGLTELSVNGDALPVSDYRGIDADTSPLKLRACFRQDWTQSAASDADAQPLNAPVWFDCFDAGQLTEDLAAGRARALRIARDEPPGFDIYVARYPDGRAFLWRQINACGAARFAGDPPPEGCPAADGG